MYKHSNHLTVNALAYVSRGNLASDGSWTFGYDSENRWTSTGGMRSATLAYDAIGRLARVSGNGTTEFLELWNYELR